MDDHLIDTTDDLHLLRVIGQIHIGEGVFVVDVIAANVMCAQVKRFCERVSPEIQNDSPHS